MHGLINYADTTAKCRYLKNWSVKGTQKSLHRPEQWPAQYSLNHKTYWKSTGNCNIHNGTLRYIKYTLNRWRGGGGGLAVRRKYQYQRSCSTTHVPKITVKLKAFYLLLWNLLTYTENAYWNPLQDSLLCDWSMFSCVEPLLAAGKMRKIHFVTGSFRYDFLYAFSGSKSSLYSLWRGLLEGFEN